MTLLSLVIACSSAAAAHDPAPPSVPAPAALPRDPRDASSRIVRIVLAEGVQQVRLTSAGAWTIFAADGRTGVALTQPGEPWLLTSDGRGILAQREDSRPVTAREQTVIARPTAPGGQIAFNGKRWRGEMMITRSGTGMLVVNRLPIDDYLKGVVPREIGTTSPSALAAVEAQAITARSYAVTHLAPARSFDMRATVDDQVYGGATAETSVGNAAVDATAGLVLLYRGRVVNAPYSSTCGGTTAEPQDVWRSAPEPYLKRVSDQVPGSTRFYCDAAPRYRWSQSFGQEALRQNLTRYLRTLPGRDASVGTVRDVSVADVTPGGRVGTLVVQTDGGRVTLRGNEMRYALRLPGGEILHSTYFSVESSRGSSGVEKVTLSGGGNGHGIGMCQAGAIGRAREGQDFRTILGSYYPGTTVGTIQ